MQRPFRFGYQTGDGTGEELRTDALRAEAAGFDVFHTYDHVDAGWAPLPPLLSAAEATTSLRVCALVLNNDFHHPVHLAREIASIDHLTDGRVELGLGAGHSFTEYAAIGLEFEAPASRKARLGEAIEILRPLLNGETVTYEGEHYHLDNVRTMRSKQDRLPIVVGVNGRAALAHAARHAETIGLTMLGRTLKDGQRHEVRWQADRLDATIEHIRRSSNDATGPPEINALVQRIVITDDRRSAIDELVAARPTLAVSDAMTTPFVAIGTVDEIVEHLLTCRARWGISYFSVREIDSFQPVIERLRAVDGRN